MKTISTFEIADCNKEIERAGLGYRLHMHDMCGGQSLDVEELPQGAHDQVALHELVERVLGSEAAGRLGR